MAEVFVSYKQEERERMRPIADGLRSLGVDVWFDERLQPDRSFTEEIHEIINSCKAQLVCWSPAAVASEWVRGEAEYGRQRAVLVAATVESCDLPPPFNMHHAENLTGWSGDPSHPGWRKICESIGRKLGRPGLGELAALQGSADARAWKKWAQKYPTDPHADQAWAEAEELEIGAARERVARERERAQRVAEEAASDSSVVTREPEAFEQRVQSTRNRSGPMPIVIAALAFIVVIGAAAFWAVSRNDSAGQGQGETELESVAEEVADAEPTTEDFEAAAADAVEEEEADPQARTRSAQQRAIRDLDIVREAERRLSGRWVRQSGSSCQGFPWRFRRNGVTIELVFDSSSVNLTNYVVDTDPLTLETSGGHIQILRPNGVIWDGGSRTAFHCYAERAPAE